MGATVVQEEQAQRPPGRLAEKPRAAAPALAEPAVAFGLGSFRNLSMAEVRRAIVLNEVLGPPLATRGSEQTWDRF